MMILVLIIWFGRGNDTVGNPHRAHNSRFEFFELVLLLRLDKQSLSTNSRQQYLSQQYPPTLNKLPYMICYDIIRYDMTWYKMTRELPSGPPGAISQRSPFRWRSSWRKHTYTNIINNYKTTNTQNNKATNKLTKPKHTHTSNQQHTNNQNEKVTEFVKQYTMILYDLMQFYSMVY